MEKNKKNKIPKATAKRLALYSRYFKSLHHQGIERINSSELAQALQIDSATIRRDFSYFGSLGKRGFGYNVEELMHFFATTLSNDQFTKVAIVGVGNIGTALMHYKFHQSHHLKISTAFDNNPQLIGKKIDDIPIHSMDELKNVLRNEEIQVVILSVPEQVAQEVTDKLVDAGVKGILNFTPRRILAPRKANVVIQSVDLTSELQTLIYFLNKS